MKKKEISGYNLIEIREAKLRFAKILKDYISSKEINEVLKEFDEYELEEASASL